MQRYTDSDLVSLVRTLLEDNRNLRQENRRLQHHIDALRRSILLELHEAANSSTAQTEAELKTAHARIARLEQRIVEASLNVPTEPYDWQTDSKIVPDDTEGPTPSS